MRYVGTSKISTGTRAIKMPQVGRVKPVLILPQVFAEIMMPCFAAMTRNPIMANSLAKMTNTGNSEMACMDTRGRKTRIKILSAKGSMILPKSLTMFKRRASQPSSQSVEETKMNKIMVQSWAMFVW